jgi:4-hydroxy-2-oxoheptanedioate aldolase
MGAALRRDVGYVLGPGSKEYVQQLEEGVVALMIEKRAAIENLEAILAVKGVDMVQFGPADYSMSVGVPGQWKHPRVTEAEEYIIKTAINMGVAPRVELMDFKDAGPYLEMGVEHFCIGWDVFIIQKFCQEQGAAFRKAFGR